MKVKVYVPQTFEIPDNRLASLARTARRRGDATSIGMSLHSLVEIARLDGIIKIDEDFVTDGDDDRYYYRGKIRTSHEVFDLQRKREEPQ
jgi:hypothetical protein